MTFGSTWLEALGMLAVAALGSTVAATILHRYFGLLSPVGPVLAVFAAAAAANRLRGRQ